MRASEAFPELDLALSNSDAQRFKARASTLLPRFEAARAGSPRRAEIARFLCREAERELSFSDEQGTRSLDEAMALPAEPLPWARVDLPGPGKLVPSVSFEGRLHQGPRLAGLAAELEHKRLLTPAARDALLWINEHAQADQGLSLKGQRFVLLGAAAELAPTELLLSAGADVLWIDVREPTVDVLLGPRLGGSIRYVRGGADLLRAPQAVAATVQRFADEGGPVHVGMYAYAGGEGQAFRLTAAMNAIVRRLPPSALASCAMLLSPTTPSPVHPDDWARAEQRKAEAPGWMRALYAARQLRDGFEPVMAGAQASGHVARAIVKTQGMSYQAAQYVGKMLTAEAYAVYGNQLADSPSPMTVSANVAPITSRFCSRAHPVVEAAFLGAPAFHILIAKSEASRTLSGLLSLHDLLNPDAPGSARRAQDVPVERAAGIFSQQIHGGVYAQPYALEGCISVAALRGLTRRPGLALGLRW